MVSGFNHIDLGTIRVDVKNVPIEFNKDISDRLNSFKNSKILYASLIMDVQKTTMLFTPALDENGVYLYITGHGKDQIVLNKSDNKWSYVLIGEQV